MQLSRIALSAGCLLRLLVIRKDLDNIQIYIRDVYRFSDIKFHKAKGRNPSKSYSFSTSSRLPTDNAVKFNIWKSIDPLHIQPYARL